MEWKYEKRKKTKWHVLIAVALIVGAIIGYLATNALTTGNAKSGLANKSIRVNPDVIVEAGLDCVCDGIDALCIGFDRPDGTIDCVACCAIGIHTDTPIEE